MPKVSLDSYFEIQKRGEALVLTPKDAEDAALSNAIRILRESSQESIAPGHPPLIEHHLLLNLVQQKALLPQQLRPLMELQQEMTPSLRKLVLFGGAAQQLRATLRTAGVDRAISYFSQESDALEHLGLNGAPVEDLSPQAEKQDLVTLSEALTPFFQAVREVMQKGLGETATPGEVFPKLLIGRSLISFVGIRTPIEFDGFCGEYTLSLPRRTLEKLAALRELPLTDLEDAKLPETLIGGLASTAFVMGRDAMKKQGIKLLKAPVLSILPPSKYALYDERVIPRVIRPYSTAAGDFFIEIYNRGASEVVFPS